MKERLRLWQYNTDLTVEQTNERLRSAVCWWMGQLEVIMDRCCSEVVADEIKKAWEDSARYAGLKLRDTPLEMHDGDDIHEDRYEPMLIDEDRAEWTER